jgi:hypothetical protein
MSLSAFLWHFISNLLNYNHSLHPKHSFTNCRALIRSFTVIASELMLDLQKKACLEITCLPFLGRCHWFHVHSEAEVATSDIEISHFDGIFVPTLFNECRVLAECPLIVSQVEQAVGKQLCSVGGGQWVLGSALTMVRWDVLQKLEFSFEWIQRLVPNFWQFYLK